jgi:hypothetical protein
MQSLCLRIRLCRRLRHVTSVANCHSDYGLEATSSLLAAQLLMRHLYCAYVKQDGLGLTAVWLIRRAKLSCAALQGDQQHVVAG